MNKSNKVSKRVRYKLLCVNVGRLQRLERLSPAVKPDLISAMPQE